MTTRKPRLIMAFAAVILLAVLALFAVALLNANASDRHAAERRFRDKARVSAALTESLFSLTQSQGAAQNTKNFGGATIPERKLTAAAKQGSLRYIVVLDANGIPIGLTPGVPTAVIKRIQSKPEDV